MRLKLGDLEGARTLWAFEGAPFAAPTGRPDVARNLGKGDREIFDLTDERAVRTKLALNPEGLIRQYGFALNLVVLHGKKELEWRAGSFPGMTRTAPFAV